VTVVTGVTPVTGVLACFSHPIERERSICIDRQAR
jgi:hypothetical protein